MARKPKPKTPAYGEPARSFRCSDSEWSEIERRAKARGLSTSAYLRERALIDTDADALRTQLRDVGADLLSVIHRLSGITSGV